MKQSYSFKMRELTPEQIEKNWNQYCGFFEQLGERTEAAKKLLEAVGESLASAPASSRNYYHNSFIGGLVEHSLRVLKNALKLKKTFAYDVSNESLIIACLFHDLGKACFIDGSGNRHDYYLPNESEWHKDKCGEMFVTNEKIPYMLVPHRSLFLCQKFGLTLTYDEFMAILLNDGQFVDENKAYRGCKEPLLATIVHTADYLATREEKELYNSSI